MKKAGIIFLSAACLFTVLAQDKLFIHKTDKSVLEVLVSTIDSLSFGSNQTVLNIHKTDHSISSYAVATIDSLNFGNGPDTVTITYNGASATVVNPLKKHGVEITQSGADIVVNSALDQNEVTYILSGTATEGSFKVYSNYRLNLNLNGVNISNSDGPAINIQSGKKISVNLAVGTTNVLTDGAVYATSTEDQKAAFFSEGQLQFTGSGSLSVKSNNSHAICSDDYIQIDAGNIAVTGAVKDGIHSKDYFRMNGGTLNVTATGDGVDCELGDVIINGGSITTVNAVADTKGISCDSLMTITGGTLNLTVSGNQSKGLKSKQAMTLSGGNITINTSGGVVLAALGSGYDASYCTAIKGNTNVDIAGANITIKSTGAAGKGISADGSINMSSGTVNITCSGTGTTYVNSSGVKDSYNSSCFTASANLNVTGGSLTCSSSGAGGKGMSADGTITIGSTTSSPTINLTTTGAKFLVSGTDYCHPKTMVSNGAITLNNGTTTISSTDDAIHSETSLTINGGTNTVTTSLEGIESKYIYITGGTNTINSSNDGINVTMGTVSGGTESNDNSLLSISGGTTYVTGADAIDSNGNFTMTGGIVFSNGPSSGAEEYCDINGNCNINGGVFVGCGSSQMQKAPSTTSTQACLFIKTTLSNSTMYTVAVAGVGVVSFKPKNGGGACLISTPQMTKGASYVIYTGGSYSGGTSTNNLYLDGVFSNSGATNKKSATLSTSTTVNSITI
ncbi:MAG: carbohydrate-binding domain-containing protein [Paludibacter sp.]